MHAPDNTDMVECLVKRPTWYNGDVADPGTVVSLEKADAQYAVSIGRVEIVPPAEAEPGASKAGHAQDLDPDAHPDTPPRRSNTKGKTRGTAVTLDIHDVTSGQTAQEVTKHG